MTRTASKAAPKTNRVFAEGTCHHRDESDKPDCRKKIESKGAQLCPPHQKAWSQAARGRAQARKAAAPKADSKIVQVAKRQAPPSPERKPAARAAMVAVEPTVTKVT